MYIQGYISIYMQNCNQYENCDWNPRHRRSTMHMRIQGRFWCLLVISFFEVIYERKNFALLRDQSYLFAQGKTAKCNHNCKSGKKKWWMLKELQEANIQRFSEGLACLSSLSKGHVLVFCWCVSICGIIEPYNFCVLPDYREMFSHWLCRGKKAAERSDR